MIQHLFFELKGLQLKVILKCKISVTPEWVLMLCAEFILVHKSRLLVGEKNNRCYLLMGQATEVLVLTENLSK